MNTFTVWISRSNDLDKLLEIDNDLLRYDCLNWQEAMDLFKLSLEQGYTLILCHEEQEAECNDATPEKC